MYGLLKSCTCTKSRSEREARRLAYCGSCKSIGSLFGQQSRLLLNNDAVFLAELLFGLQDGTSTEQTRPAPATEYRSYNCMSIPDVGEIPKELAIAASINVLLVQFKVLDQLHDSPGLAWKIADKVFSGAFASAARILEQHSFPLFEAFDWLAEQIRRERKDQTSHQSDTSLDLERLRWLSEPTAKVTGMFFQRATIACGHDEATADSAFRLGYNFGSLVYVLDALEDYELDRRRNQFNAIRNCSALNGPLTDKIRLVTIANIKSSVESICTCLAQLPLPASLRDEFVARFRRNSQQRLKAASSKDQKRERHRESINSGKSSSAKPSCQSQSVFVNSKGGPRHVYAGTFAKGIIASSNLKDNWLQWLAWVYCYMFALLFPRGAEIAETLSDCLEMPFNLIFLGNAGADLLSFFRSMIFSQQSFAAGPAGGSGSGPTIPGGHLGGSIDSITAEEKKRQRENCCNDCCENCDCSGCCDCGDCCGGCGNDSCGHCNCGHCDCGHCDCGHCDCGGCDCGGCDCNCH